MMMSKGASILALLFLALAFDAVASSQEPQLGSARVVFQTNYGDIEFGFFPDVAPKTVDHIFKLVRLGCYNTNHFFRVDRGFVAQVADVVGGRSAPMNEEQREEAVKTVVGEFSDVKHLRGILSMGRYADPDSASSSFSILLGDAPHLDGQYAIFGRVTEGEETLKKLEQLPTRREGIFVMPTERITILSSYFYGGLHGGATLFCCSEGVWSFLQASLLLIWLETIPSSLVWSFIYEFDIKMETCEQEKSALRRRLAASVVEIERQRMKCFP